MQQWRTCHCTVHRLHLCQLLSPPSAGRCWFPSPSTSTQCKHWKDKQGRKPRALHDVALCGPTTIFNNCQPCLGNGGLAWRRFCLLFCWAACNVQNNKLEPWASQISPYFCLKGCKPFPPSLHPPCIFQLGFEQYIWVVTELIRWFETAQKVLSLQGRVLRGAKESIHLKGRVNLHLVSFFTAIGSFHEVISLFNSQQRKELKNKSIARIYSLISLDVVIKRAR